MSKEEEREEEAKNKYVENIKIAVNIYVMLKSSLSSTLECWRKKNVTKPTRKTHKYNTKHSKELAKFNSKQKKIIYRITGTKIPKYNKKKYKEKRQKRSTNLFFLVLLLLLHI